MNFFISDTEFENKQRNEWGTLTKTKSKKFGQWYYRFEDCQVYKTDTRLIIYSGYTAEKTINEYIKTDPYSLKHAEGDFCVAILEKETMEVFADYICQTKYGRTETIKKCYMMPLTAPNINTLKFNTMKAYNKHRINKYDSFDVTDARWQEAKSEIQKTIVEATRNIRRIIDGKSEKKSLECFSICKQYKIPSKHLMEYKFGGVPANGYYSKYVMGTSGTLKTIKDHFPCSTRKLILLNQVYDKKFINRYLPCYYQLGFYETKSDVSFYTRICFQYKNSGSFMYNDKQTMIIPTYELSKNLQKVYANGDKYVGTFINGKYNCLGTYTWALAKKEYAGEWKDGIQHGWGTMTWVSGAKYVGGYKNSEMHGQGTYTYTNGDKYVGKFINGKYNGEGTYTWGVAKKEYVGQWKDSIQHGQGTLTYASGDKYIGQFKDGKFCGQGTFIYANGDKYTGEWKDDKRA